ncbi:MAG: hypothetical protein QMC65_03345 [Candidatus Poseidoniaceae archaeon]|jgi:uncharacterized OB-fold protein|tara:strand:- start:1235 stop:2083 length:849 start_codon:yes stop_codon:yes gene_type:complete
MDEHVHWKGYLAVINKDGLYIQSSYVHGDQIVYGPDSDSTTMGIAAIQLMLNKGHLIESMHLPDSVDARIVYLATGVDSMTHNSELEFENILWDLLGGDEATLVITKSNSESYDFEEPQDVEIIDTDFHNDMAEAWRLEQETHHVSQGAYVSKSQYLEGAPARLSLRSQKVGDRMIWPPRQLDENGSRFSEDSHQLVAEAHVESWTKLSAAGAPSEFSLRAPILGGIQTLLVRFEQGPRGVFLVTDDLDYSPEIGDTVHFAVRRIYAQEGMMRYGLKAFPKR